jgi:hypothetical protein
MFARRLGRDHQSLKSRRSSRLWNPFCGCLENREHAVNTCTQVDAESVVWSPCSLALEHFGKAWEALGPVNWMPAGCGNASLPARIH